MSEVNIKYDSNSSKVTIQSVQSNISSKLATKNTEYDAILAAFTVSECEQATAVRKMIEKEKRMVDAIVNFYTGLLSMIESAGNDIDETENAFSIPHLTK